MKLLITILGVVAAASAMEHEVTELRMPGAIVTAPETYLCHSMKVDGNHAHYVTEFRPHGTMKEAHHILVFGCAAPGSNKNIWGCGEMEGGGQDDVYDTASPCGEHTQILYAWGRDADSLKLPEGVGFKVGGDSDIAYLVVQVHYMMALDHPDHSGVDLISTTIPQPKLASVMIVLTDGVIRAHTTEDFEAACVIDEPVEMHPFAFRVHAHVHGQVVSGWKVTEDEQGEDKWELIGKGDPLKPQMFNPVANPSMTIQEGDVVAARCHMKNDGNEDVKIGSTGDDEMCNFYMMYWVDGDNTLSDNTCISPGPPEYYWGKQGALNHIPDKEANAL